MDLDKIIRIIYHKGLEAKLKNHLHERNAIVEVLQNILVSYSITTRGFTDSETQHIQQIAQLIKHLLI